MNLSFKNGLIQGRPSEKSCGRPGMAPAAAFECFFSDGLEYLKAV
ncbi:hypothetical protein [Neisseria dentiae]|nr:hypothetical protein [Neisseria dentiae]